MWMHVVLYKSYAGNPNAAEKIIQKARYLLRDPIMTTRVFFVGPVINTGRAVGDASYDVMLAIGFYYGKEEYESYMKFDENHRRFAHFVLRGWMLEDGDSANAEQEFIDHVLKDGKKRKWVRNPAVPDKEVVWGGEVVVYDAMS